jgi:hypothetical protein
MRITLDPADALEENRLEGLVWHIFNTILDVNVVQLRYTDSNKQVEVFRPGYKEAIHQMREFTWRHNVRLQKEGDQNHHSTEQAIP